MSNPVRIYVLHHPDSKIDPVTRLQKGLAASLTNRIYDWFRLPNLEGIPVYVHYVTPKGGKRILLAHTVTKVGKHVPIPEARPKAQTQHT